KAALFCHIAGTGRDANKVVRRRDGLMARGTVGAKRSWLTGQGYGNGGLTGHRWRIYSGWQALIEFALAEHFQGTGHGVPIRETHFRHFLQAAQDNFFQGWWDMRIQLAGWHGRVLNMLHGYCHWRITVERRAPGQHFIHDDAKRIDVSSRVDNLALSLLGRVVLHGT